MYVYVRTVGAPILVAVENAFMGISWDPVETWLVTVECPLPKPKASRMQSVYEFFGHLDA